MLVIQLCSVQQFTRLMYSAAAFVVVVVVVVVMVVVVLVVIAAVVVVVVVVVVDRPMFVLAEAAGILPAQPTVDVKNKNK